MDNVCAVVADEVQAGAVFLGEQVCNRVEGASACHCEFNSAALQLVEYLEEIPGEFFPVVEQGAVHVACDELYHMYISSLLFCLFFFLWLCAFVLYYSIYSARLQVIIYRNSRFCFDLADWRVMGLRFGLR